MAQAMTPRQRLLVALARQEPDQVPVTFHGVYPYNVGEPWRCSDPSYRPLLELARSQTDLLCAWTLDQGTFYTQVEMQWTPVGDGFVEEKVETPYGPISRIMNVLQQHRKAFLQEDTDIEQFLSIPYRPVRPDVTPAWELEHTVGERGLLYTGGLDALGVVADLFTPEDFALRCHYDKPLILRLLEKVFQHLYDYVHYTLDHGPRSLYSFGGAEYATAPLLSPAYFDEFAVRFGKPLIELIHQHGSLVEIHCHGRLDGVLERIAGMGADALHPVEAPPMGDVTLAEAKRRVGDRLCLVGNIQIGDLIGLTPSDIDQVVWSALSEAAPGGGFILSTTASPYEPVLSPRTLRNYRQLVETAQRFSEEPPTAPAA